MNLLLHAPPEGWPITPLMRALAKRCGDMRPEKSGTCCLATVAMAVQAAPGSRYRNNTFNRPIED
jgi:hypothetical protein